MSKAPFGRLTNKFPERSSRVSSGMFANVFADGIVVAESGPRVMTVVVFAHAAQLTMPPGAVQHCADAPESRREKSRRSGERGRHVRFEAARPPPRA